MGKSFKDKMKNTGNFISETIVDAGKQVKDSEMFDKISKGTKDGLGFVTRKVKDGAERFSEGTKTSVDMIKNAVSEHKKQGTQDVIKSKEQNDKKEKKIDLDDQLHNAVNRYNAAYAEFENNGSEILRQRERSVDLLENVENLVNSIANHPKNFDADFKEIQLYKKEFKDVCDYAKKELDAAKKSMAGVGAGVAGVMYMPKYSKWMLTGVALVSLWALLLVIAYYRTAGSRFGEEELLLVQGYFRKTYCFLPYRKIQYVELKQNFPAKLVRLQKGEIHLLASARNRIQNLPYFPEEDGEILKERILR